MAVVPIPNMINIPHIANLATAGTSDLSNITSTGEASATETLVTIDKILNGIIVLIFGETYTNCPSGKAVLFP